MLPSSRKPTSNIKKYSETAIPFLVDEMVKMGVKKDLLTAKICGGATMFKHVESSLMVV